MPELINTMSKMTHLVVPEAEYLNRKACEYVHAGRCEDAIGLFDQAIALDPCSADTWYNQGACLDELGRYRDAIECYNQSIRIDPFHAESWYNKGVGLKKLGNFQDAEQCIDQALRLAQGIEE